MTTLDQMPRGKTGRISGFTGDAARIDQLRELGFQEGLIIEYLYASPFGGDPIAVAIGPMTVALRRSEAGLIHVEL